MKQTTNEKTTNEKTTRMNDLRYPTGKYQPVDEVTPAYVEACIAEIAALPALMRKAVEGLSEQQLNTPYRPDGWTVKQVVHHVGDSHLNSIVRFKWTMTEDTPKIKAYDEKEWAASSDVPVTPVAVNLMFIEALHQKWVHLLRSLEMADWSKSFVHPDTGRQLTLGWLLGLYAWHGKHHVAHINGLRSREGWV